MMRFSNARKSALIALAVAALVVVPAIEAAAAQQYYTASRKFGRGAAGIGLGILEIPGNVVFEGRDKGALYGATAGLALGLGKFVARELVGVYELLSAPFEAPEGFKPVLQPEYPWQYFEAAPRR